ncbi:hypothetical protein BDZ85DRAFT_261845 [Elsinoe ampelina]|uniref:Uncharacterized protein n=1 Tax=Elsinoe ampelina TaxID=302913 RepID=A0A6A6GD26_9PEZI|nr:hypothetical protein BDZ85DRAFT_261845 [Elsinoe ampelina]
MERARESMRVDEESKAEAQKQLTRMTREAQSLVAELLKAWMEGRYEERLKRFESCDGAVW